MNFVKLTKKILTAHLKLNIQNLDNLIEADLKHLLEAVKICFYLEAPLFIFKRLHSFYELEGNEYDNKREKYNFISVMSHFCQHKGKFLDKTAIEALGLNEERKTRLDALLKEVKAGSHDTGLAKDIELLQTKFSKFKFDDEIKQFMLVFFVHLSRRCLVLQSQDSLTWPTLRQVIISALIVSVKMSIDTVSIYLKDFNLEKLGISIKDATQWESAHLKEVACWEVTAENFKAAEIFLKKGVFVGFDRDSAQKSRPEFIKTENFPDEKALANLPEEKIEEGIVDVIADNVNRFAFFSVSANVSIKQELTKKSNSCNVM